MDRPPPYNPVCEPHSSNLVSPTSFSSRCSVECSVGPSVPDCSPPEYQTNFHRRSYSSLPRRPVPPIRRNTGSFVRTGSPPNTLQPPALFNTPDRRHSYNTLPRRPVPPPPTQRHAGCAPCSELENPPAYDQQEDYFLSRREVDNSLNRRFIQEPSQVTLQSRSNSQAMRQFSGSSQSNLSGVYQHTGVQPVAPLRRVSSEVHRRSTVGVPYRCFVSDGLKEPTWIACSDSGKVLVVDASAMTANIYSQEGVKQSAFQVIGIRGGCFWMENKLALATVRGITICQLDGKVLRQSTVGSVLGTKTYNFGFIGIRKQELMIYGGCDGQLMGNIISRKRPGILRKSHKFKSISDVAVNSHKNIVVLDVGSAALYVVNEMGIMQQKIRLSSSHIPNGPIKEAYGVTVDRQGAIIVSDHGNKRVMRFSSDGQYVKCIVDFVQGMSVSDARGLCLFGVEMSRSLELYVGVSSKQSSEVRIYSI